MSRKQLTDTELDALVVRSLSRLPVRAPSRGFSKRVMDRVQLPSPRPVRAFQRVRSWVAQPRRALALAGAYVVAATVALVIAVPWLITHSPAIGFVFNWMAARGSTLARDVAVSAARWAVSSGFAELFGSVPLKTTHVWILAFGATAAYAGCAIGLHFLLRAPREKHVPAHVQA